jgi:uncharacterized protein (TIGR03435 family)
MRVSPGFAVLVAVLAAAAQEPASTPAFEVASVKPTAGGPLKVQSDPGRLTILDESLDVLIELAYGLREYQYEGPKWLHTTRFDIAATTSTPAPRAAQMVMLRTLLADRFKLKTHVESRTMPVYWLVVGKNGPKLKPLDAAATVPFDLYYNISMVPGPNGTTAMQTVGSLGLLADFLSRLAERPVIDRTGITGAFEFRLLCAIDGFPGAETSPSVFDAVQSQMGLKLEPHADKVDVRVVDQAESPKGN